MRRKTAGHAGIITAAAMGIMLLAASSEAGDSKKGSSSSSSKDAPRGEDKKKSGDDKKGGGGRKGEGEGGFDGQISVPAPFGRGKAFLLMGDSYDCRLRDHRWMGMADDTRDRNEAAGGLTTPGYPIACERNGQSVTCKVFKNGFTVGFNASVKTDTASQLSFVTAGGYIETVIDLQKRTATFKQTVHGDTSECTTTYKSREDAAADVAKLDPPPMSSLPEKERPNGMMSGGDRIKCQSRHETKGAKDPLTGRKTPVCSACSADNCGFIGEECIRGVCIYTGKGDTRGEDTGPSDSGGSSASRPTQAKKANGAQCAHNYECASGECGTISSGALHKCVAR